MAWWWFWLCLYVGTGDGGGDDVGKGDGGGDDVGSDGEGSINSCVSQYLWIMILKSQINFLWLFYLQIFSIYKDSDL